ncbi:MAG: hypothetical protein K2H45_13850, partial [Acetatifactor sp.]|nr:hypothetical protein [Acetatifactor sp.]
MSDKGKTMPYLDVTPVAQVTNRLRPFGQLLTGHKEKQEKCQRVLDTNLSEAFLEKTEHPMVELEVKMININLPSGHKLLKECRPMYEYSWFIQRIKEYLTAGWIRDAAIIQAV